MFDLLKAAYKAGKIDSTGLDAAIIRGWITADQKQQIITAGTD